MSEKILTDREWLKRPCKYVKFPEMSAHALQVYERLVAALKEHNALGLAANQIGSDLRMIVINGVNGPHTCIANPIITSARGRQTNREACLSLPGVILSVKRPLRIRVQGDNQYGNRVSFKFEGMQARIACHEIDHINGVLMIDKVSKDK